MAVPPKEPYVRDKLREALEKGDYRFTNHALARMEERNITSIDVRYVLREGSHEAKKDAFDSLSGRWKYAIRGRTVDARDIRIIIVFANQMMIVTVIDKER